MSIVSVPDDKDKPEKFKLKPIEYLDLDSYVVSEYLWNIWISKMKDALGAVPIIEESGAAIGKWREVRDEPYAMCRFHGKMPEKNSKMRHGK